MSHGRVASLALGGLLALAVAASALVPSPPRSGSPATAAGASASDTGAAADSAPELGETVRYRVGVRSGAGSEAAWRVVQGPEVATLLAPSSPGTGLEAAFALTGAAVGGGPVLVKRDRDALVPMWADGPVFRPGLASSGRGAKVLRSLEYRFRRGARDRQLFGRRAQHWVLEAELRVVFRPAMERLGADSADAHLRTDFWFLREVPFSWAPLVPSGVGALSLGMEPVDRLLRRDLEPKLRRLGLPVATETTERWEAFGTPDVAIPTDSRRGSRVRELRKASPPAAHPPYLEYPVSVPAGSGTDRGDAADGDQSSTSSSASR